MTQDNEPVPDARTPEELDLIKTLERLEGRTLTEREINLAIAQARALGDL